MEETNESRDRIFEDFNIYKNTLVDLEAKEMAFLEKIINRRMTPKEVEEYRIIIRNIDDAGEKLKCLREKIVKLTTVDI